MALHPSRKGEGWGTHSLREAASPLGRGSHGFEGFGEVFREGLLGFGREFFVNPFIDGCYRHMLIVRKTGDGAMRRHMRVQYHQDDSQR